MSITLKYILDHRSVNSTGKSPLKLRVIHNRTSAHLSLGYYILPSEWDDRNERLRATSKSFNNVSRFNNELQSRKAKFFDVIGELDREGILNDISSAQLKTYLTKKPTTGKSVFQFIQQQYEMKMLARKIGTARTYRDLANRLRKFVPERPDLSFIEVDYKFLVDLEHDHIGKGNKYSSLSVYLRTLRALYNEAIKTGVVSKRHYPFEKYSIKSGEPSRRALTKENFQLLVNRSYDLGSALQIGRDYYLASFYLHGINWMDLCMLRYANISDDGERVQYVRQKTGKAFNVKISNSLKTIINRLKPFNTSIKKDFVFPILKLEDSAGQYSTKITNRRLKINKYLKLTANDLEISGFSIYSARHTFATMLWEKSGSASITQQTLGHKTEEQTQEYLSHFGNDKIDDASQDLFENI